jgi:hypothetical protein
MVSGEKVNKSDRIRGLFDSGLSVTEISNAIGVRYQFAYNVVSYYVRQKEALYASTGRVASTTGFRMDR